jgi:hypothetical protein
MGKFVHVTAKFVRVFPRKMSCFFSFAISMKRRLGEAVCVYNPPKQESACLLFALKPNGKHSQLVITGPEYGSNTLQFL